MAHHSEEQQTNIGYDRSPLTTLGKCILDDLYLPNGENKSRVLGGSGVYSILVAHLFSSDAEAKRLSWLIRAGRAFPRKIVERLHSWGTDLMIEKCERDEVEWREGSYNIFVG